MAINPNANFNELTTWLEENLTDNKSIKACCQEVNKVPETKGIYFWFMHSDGYSALSIKPIEPKYTRNISGVKYDLVYLGTAGVRNNSNGLNNGHLKERLKWHLCDNKGISGLCSGTMSTYRRTIGGLISDDLIANNTQDKIDELLCKYFMIYYVEYPGAFLDVKDEVNGDEDLLINVIRPILNLDKNPNADIPTHITYMIQQRRQKIEKDSKKRCCKEKTNNNSKIISSKPIQNLEKENKVVLEIDCVTFEVKRNENISIVADSISNLPTGPCSIELFYSNRADVRIYINGRKRNIPTLKRSVSQYFNAPDTANGKIPKWKIVQNEMNESTKIIEKIIVRVCPIENKRNSKTNSGIKVTPIPTIFKAQNNIKNTLVDKKINEQLELDWDKLKDKKSPKLLIIGCCDAKSHQPKDLINGGHINFSFGNSIEKLIKSRIEFYKKLPDNYFSKKKRNRKPADKNYFMNSLNENNRREALDVYGSNRSPFYNPEMKKLYKDKIKNSNLHLLIISGLYGIIKHDDYINDYHLEIGRGGKKWAGSQIQEVVKKYISDNKIPNDNVFYSLSDNYLPFLKPIPQWENLWLNHDGHGDNQAKDLITFLDIL